MSVQEDRLAAADRLADVLSRVVGTASHPSGMVTVTASAVGALKSVRIHPAALGRGPDAVGRLVVETARLATDAAVQTSYNELAKSLGDGMAMAIEDFAGPPPFRRVETDAAGPRGATAGAPGTHGPTPGVPEPHGRPGGTAGPLQHAPGPHGRPRTTAGPLQHAPEPHRRPHGAPGPHGQVQDGPDGYGQPQGSRGGPPTGRYAPGGQDSAPYPQGTPGTAYPQGGPGAGGSGPGRPAPPWAGQQGGPARPRPVPPPAEDDDDDDFFADPFRGQRR